MTWLETDRGALVCLERGINILSTSKNVVSEAPPPQILTVMQDGKEISSTETSGPDDTSNRIERLKVSFGELGVDEKLPSPSKNQVFGEQLPQNEVPPLASSPEKSWEEQTGITFTVVDKPQDAIQPEFMLELQHERQRISVLSSGTEQECKTIRDRIMNALKNPQAHAGFFEIGSGLLLIGNYTRVGIRQQIASAGIPVNWVVEAHRLRSDATQLFVGDPGSCKQFVNKVKSQIPKEKFSWLDFGDRLIEVDTLSVIEMANTGDIELRSLIDARLKYQLCDRAKDCEAFLNKLRKELKAVEIVPSAEPAPAEQLSTASETAATA